MKAAEYAEEFCRNRAAHGFPAAAKKLLGGMLHELVALSSIRCAHSNEAGIALLEEFDQKCQRIAELIGPGVRGDGFRRLIEDQYPDMYQLWMAARAAKRANVSRSSNAARR